MDLPFILDLPDEYNNHHIKISIDVFGNNNVAFFISSFDPNNLNNSGMQGGPLTHEQLPLFRKWIQTTNIPVGSIEIHPSLLEEYNSNGDENINFQVIIHEKIQNYLDTYHNY